MLRIQNDVRDPEHTGTIHTHSPQVSTHSVTTLERNTRLAPRAASGEPCPLPPARVSSLTAANAPLRNAEADSIRGL